MVYLVRNYRNPKLKNKNNLARLSSNKVFDYEGDLTCKEVDKKLLKSADDHSTDKSFISIYALKSMDKSIFNDARKMN